jgi:hypothetical protein
MAKFILALVITIVLGTIWLSILEYGEISYLIFILYFGLYYVGVNRLNLNRSYNEYIVDWFWEQKEIIE